MSYHFLRALTLVALSLIALNYRFLKTQSLSSLELSLHHLVSHEWFDLEFAYRIPLLADQSFLSI